MHNDVIQLGMMNATWIDGTTQGFPTFETVGWVILILVCLIVGTTSAINFYVYITADFDMFLYFVLESALECIISVVHIIIAFLNILNINNADSQINENCGDSILLIVSNVFFHLGVVLLCAILLASSLTRWAALTFYVWYYSFRNDTIRPKIYALYVLSAAFAVYLLSLGLVTYFFNDMWSLCSTQNSVIEIVFLSNTPALIIVLTAFCFIYKVHLKMNNPPAHSSIPANKEAKLRNVNLLWKTSVTFIVTLIISLPSTLSFHRTYLTGYIRSLFMLHILFNVFFYHTYIQEYKKRVQEIITALRNRYKIVESVHQLEIFV